MGEIYGSIYGGISKVLANITQRMQRDRRRERVELFALHGYQPTRGLGDQLEFAVNDEFWLKSDADQKWWRVKHLPTGRNGYVPMSFIARKSEKIHLEWYDMRTTRSEAEETLLRERYIPGSFIIRTKENQIYSEALALTVKANVDGDARILHYVITRDAEDSFRVGGGRSFPTLALLIQYHAGHHSGLPQPLTFSVRMNRLIDTWEISPVDVVYSEERSEDVLGSGHFGKVIKGTHMGVVVAVKTMIIGRMSKEQFLREAEIGRDFSHDNIVRTIGVCSIKPFIVTEFLSGGNLKRFLENPENAAQLTKTEDFVPIAQKIAAAMSHLEEKGIVHRDLAARNILVGETLDIIKLADFGLARLLEDSEYYKTESTTFPYKWTAPEAFVINGNQVGKFTIASDVWSFGVVMWELFSKGAEPYDGMCSGEVYKRLMDGTYRLPCPRLCIPSIYAKILECWSLQPSERPTFNQLRSFLADPYTQ
ncbi:hypothetical protein PRIPAC_71678 [Pristionchus pacificus]|nr:hypothetical protein PRIPAC_71678 [Pristionchus pacificus]